MLLISRLYSEDNRRGFAEKADVAFCAGFCWYAKVLRVEFLRFDSLLPQAWVVEMRRMRLKQRNDIRASEGCQGLSCCFVVCGRLSVLEEQRILCWQLNLCPMSFLTSGQPVVTIL